MKQRHTHDLMRDRLLRKAGLAEPPAKPRFTIEQLAKTEWSSDFEKLMRNRLIMGALRYGLLGREDKKKYDRVGSIMRRLKTYQESGNTELLVDVANLCLCEFVDGRHPNKHFHDGDGDEHVQVVK